MQNLSYANQRIPQLVNYSYFKFQVNTQLFHKVIKNLNSSISYSMVVLYIRYHGSLA